MAGNKTMRAVQYDSYGGGAAALKHVDHVPIPSPKQGEVLLKLEATSLNPVDWKIQKGLLRPFLPPKFPFIPAIDVAGEVVQAGPRVDNFSVGDRVVSMLHLKHVDDVPIPSPKPGDVLLKLEATSLNPVDWKIHKGLHVDDVPIPSPKQGEVLLKLEATSLNLVDWKIQKGLV